MMVILVGTIVTSVIAFLLWNFPWILKYRTLKIYPYKAIDDPLIAIISDMHLGSGKEDLSKLREALEMLKPRVIVVAGDLFEREHRLMDAEELRNLIKGFLEKISLKNFETMFYIVSESSHDPLPKEDVVHLIFDRKNVIVIKGGLKLRTLNVQIYVTHGDYVCRSGVVASMLNQLFLRLRKLPWMECKLRKLLRVEEDDWVIIGHTHIPLIDYEKKVANCGSWKTYWRRGGKSLIAVKNRWVKLVEIE